MKVLHSRCSYAFPVLILALGCGPDAGMIDPGTRPDDPRLASQRYSDWSNPVNLGPVVNSPFTEQQPALSKKGLSLYFASNRPTGPTDNVLDQNIWVARRPCTDGTARCAWGTPAVLGEAVNGQFLDVAPTLSRDEHQLFFASVRPNGHCSVGPCDRDLWVSHRANVHDDFGWQPAVNLGSPVNSSGEEIAPSYFENQDAQVNSSGDGDNDDARPQLFFNNGEVSGGALTRGDIFMTQMAADGSWGTPSPVSEINTVEFADQRPSIAHNGLEIYFWSNRDGIAHIWVATRERVRGLWSAPTLVPSPISDALTIQPFIHSQGNTQTLLFIRTEPGNGNDLFMSQRTSTR
jgi:hypothetical protein